MPTWAVVVIALFGCVGFVLVVLGLAWRRGDTPRCARCSYDLTSLDATNCPECNADLTREKGIVRGQRRYGLAWMGALMLFMGGVVFAGTFLTGPKFDQRKPLWLLDLELRLVEEPGEFRIKEELRRRAFDTKRSFAERQAIANLALREAQNRDSKHMRDLLSDCAMSGVVDCVKADPYMRELLDMWSSEWLATERGDHEALVLAYLIQCCGIEQEALRGVVRDALDWSVATLPTEWTPTEEYRINQAGLLLESWRNSPSSPGRATESYARELLLDAPAVALEVRPIVRADIRVPVRVHAVYPPILLGETDRIQIASRIESYRVTQDGEIVDERVSPLSGMKREYRGTPARKFTNQPEQLMLQTEHLRPGPATAHLSYRVIISLPQTEAETFHTWEPFDDDSSAALIDRTFELSETFEVVGEDHEITMWSPSVRGSEISPEMFLRLLGFSPLYYDTTPPYGWSGLWALAVGRDPESSFYWRHHDVPRPDVDLAYRVVATQGENEWSIGTLRISDVFDMTMGAFHSVRGNAPAMRPDGQGGYEWDLPEPDLDRPVSLKLVPFPEAAWGSMDITSIYGETLELGEFEIVPVEDPQQALRSRGELAPAPILDK